MASRSWIRLVRFSSFSLPPCRLTVVYVRTISPKPGAVDVRHAFEVEQQLLAILLDERVDLVLQKLVAFAERHLALQVENRHPVDDSFLDLHRRSPPDVLRRLVTAAARPRRGTAGPACLPASSGRSASSRTVILQKRPASVLRRFKHCQEIEPFPPGAAGIPTKTPRTVTPNSQNLTPANHLEGDWQIRLELIRWVGHSEAGMFRSRSRPSIRCVRHLFRCRPPAPNRPRIVCTTT